MNISILKEAGGNQWEKGNMKRIYLNDSALAVLLSLSDDEALKLKKLKPAKKITYYCLVTESFVSANGLIVRNAIRANFPKEAVRKA
ncbi:MAG: hypothetical protein JKY96_04965 [Phycisphaerales bacterium]|nr:hypothetical protein [Phycisphaerales bacterium]